MVLLIDMIKGLFVNMMILTSIVMFSNIVMHEKHLQRTLRNNIRNGILSGIFGCVLMLFSVPITDQIIVDFRYIPVIMMALYVADYASFEAAIIIGIFRLIFWGVNEASILASISIIIIGLVCGIIGHLDLTISNKWFLSVVFIGLITGYSIFSLIAGIENRTAIILMYLAELVGVSVVMYYFTEYLVRFNRKIERFKEEAEKDYLTGLQNSRQFDKAIDKHLDLYNSLHMDMALLYIDIDHFKNINDKYGHTSGDMVLKELGILLKRIARSQDLISRKGGEEFTMLLVDCMLPQASNVAERIRMAVENHEFRISKNQKVKITVSIGVAAMPKLVIDKTEFLDKADQALYKAKQAGRNQVIIAGENIE